MTRHCRLPKPCMYFIQGTCEYLAMEKHRRPCKPGDACTVKREMGTQRKKAYSCDATLDAIKKLYDRGHSDPVIAEACNVTRSYVQRWRSQNNLPPNAKGGRPKKEETHE